ncbi:hypothetical protein JC525_08530 [Alteromonas sp. IB21]|uniref:hypothetical protein n=1 Tax=Alteromonas sp. IB21 TaxID=2779369 RepID=UPI0018E8F79A|nr:hypothetical protein [Alteromonas sp. IB21]MBJ2128979.1 hypothetical protein [Alteromonas sp. IB21]
MNALLHKLTTTNSQRVASTPNQPLKIQCNYADNYYGDQVCVEVKAPKSLSNLHVGVQL